MRIAVDMLGGDHAPDEIILGVAQAIIDGFSPDELLLVGRKAVIEQGLHLHGVDTIPEILHTESFIGSSESPIEGMKSKPEASILKCVGAVKAGGAQGIVAFGNTGATVASSTLGLRMIPGARRPAIAVNMLGDSGRFVLLDAGANPTPKASHMLQQAVMGEALARDVLKIEEPRIGLLNIGGEAAKGNALLKESYVLLDEAPLNFIGNIEGNEIFFGKADVVVADGFSGNTVLKVMEGFSEYLSHQAHAHSAAEGEDFKGNLRKLLGAADYTEVGGAILLGVNGTVLIGHGRSKAKTVHPALRQVRIEISAGVNKHIEESFRALSAAKSTS